MDADHLVVIGDCKHMNELQANSVQLIITSPPCFNIRAQTPHPDHFESYLVEMRQVFNECHRVLGKGRRICINFSDIMGGQFPIPAHVIFALKKCGFTYCNDILWHGRNGEDGKQTRLGPLLENPYLLHNYPDQLFGHTLVFRKGRPSRNNRVLDAQFKAVMEMDEALSCWNSQARGVCCNIPRIRPGEAQGDAYSEAILEALIQDYTFKGDTVLDPFLGNGTISKVAARLGRHSVGYEYNPYNLRVIRRKAGIPENHLKVVFQGEGRLT